MILKSYRRTSRLLAAGLIAGAGAFLGQGAAQAETYYPCSSTNNTSGGTAAVNAPIVGANAQVPALNATGNCSTLPTAGGAPATNPISVITTFTGGAPTSVVTINANPQAGGYGLAVNNATRIQSATVGDRAYGSFSADGTQVGWTNGANFTGLDVNGTRTVLSGGTLGVNSTQLALNGTNATFSNSATGAPITVTGVADGYNAFDAVNFRQLQAVSTGVASIAAMSNIPALDANKKFGIGIGYGNFQGNSALAVGVNGRLSKSLTAKVSVGAGLSYGATSVGTGLSYSW